MKKVSIIIPFYNEEESIGKFYETLSKVLYDKAKDYEFEFVFINDGSSDNGLNIVQSLQKQDNRIAYVNLSRNYGKEVAMTAGFDHVNGDAAIVIDADLQQPPIVIIEMLYWWVQGYDDVYAIRDERKGEGKLKIWLSKTYYKVLSRVSKVNVYPNAGDYRLLDSKAYTALSSIREQARYTKGLYGWVGFRKKAIHYTALPRIAGKTKWSLSKLTSLAVNGLTAYTTVPLRISTIFGLVISMFGFIYMLIVLVQKALGQGDVSGYASLMIGILLLGGVQLISLGIMGEYMARIFIETKRRPLYFVEDYKKSNMTERQKKDN